MRFNRRRRSSLNFGRTRKKFNVERFKDNLTWAIQIAAVIFMAYVCVSCFGVRTNVVGQAMSETLNNGDQVLINKFIYLVSSPKSGDVIVFLPNGNEKSHYYVRRVIGVPGDKIQIKDGAVYVNGELYNEKIEVAAMEEAGIAEEEMKLGDNEYFVLGDNRNNSEDSRYANIGNIKDEYIIGQAWYRLASESGDGFIH
ncbi:MAG: signal peptidase I [Agathobacter sp.]|nr:signal peptidase I [Agathobacter sp.]